MAALSGLFASEGQNGIARRQAMMLGVESEQRNGDRRLTTMPAAITANGRRHIGLVRDLSESGLFVYSDFEPACGHQLQLTLKVTQQDGRNVNLDCTGHVV